MTRRYIQRIAASSTLVVLAILLAALPFQPSLQSARAEDTGPVGPAADFSAQQITTMLFKAVSGQRLNLSGRDLTYLDLSDLDFKSANLAMSDFYGTDFTAAKLSGTDLTKTRLDRAVLIRADFSNANMTGATLLRPTIYADDKNTLSDAPIFAGANLTGISVQADMSGANFRGADLTNADFSPFEARPGAGTLTTQPANVLRSCDFSGARMTGANMTRAVLMFSNFSRADLHAVIFNGANLARVDFSFADVTGADFTGADLDGANFTGTRGIEASKGFDKALNADRVIR